ncbi:hypothetical protein IE81DRAFT_201801 [Ceraceosorus guamensis]|uniref:Uncharacterized protein n=1 Tax=Ceraceosorus guamensis TaxID=1522189 RepID=A0A316VTD8_9BASI|nr:hypothetical protein IE81DRAFT_201801 [Ceraceosorus guamensis]PWN40869.1 hypothetical protein IE81DRAFT_201801 [Ceraceosorus guamensis]
MYSGQLHLRDHFHKRMDQRPTGFLLLPSEATMLYCISSLLQCLAEKERMQEPGEQWQLDLNGALQLYDLRMDAQDLRLFDYVPLQLAPFDSTSIKVYAGELLPNGYDFESHFDHEWAGPDPDDEGRLLREPLTIRLALSPIKASAYAVMHVRHRQSRCPASVQRSLQLAEYLLRLVCIDRLSAWRDLPMPAGVSCPDNLAPRSEAARRFAPLLRPSSARVKSTASRRRDDEQRTSSPDPTGPSKRRPDSQQGQMHSGSKRRRSTSMFSQKDESADAYREVCILPASQELPSGLAALIRPADFAPTELVRYEELLQDLATEVRLGQDDRTSVILARLLGLDDEHEAEASAFDKQVEILLQERQDRKDREAWEREELEEAALEREADGEEYWERASDAFGHREGSAAEEEVGGSSAEEDVETDSSGQSRQEDEHVAQQEGGATSDSRKPSSPLKWHMSDTTPTLQR